MDRTRITSAYQKIRDALLAERTQQGHWVGYLASSALSTATAVSALAVYRDAVLKNHLPETDLTKIETLISGGCQWMLSHQNADGGWGDTKESPSNPSTTLLAKCALLLAGEVAGGASAFQLSSAIHLADEYLQRCGGFEAIVKRYGNDRTFSVPIMTNAALAGLVPWSEVPSLPFEFAWLPQSFFRFFNIQVVSYAIPALVAIGQLIEEKKPSKNAIVRAIRTKARQATLEKVLQMQPKSGGFLEAAPLTAFVVMSLSASNKFELNTPEPLQSVTRKVIENGLRFLYDSVREDGSWPVDTNLANWATTLSVNAILENAPEETDLNVEHLTNWILSNQHKEKHPFTGAAPGGWAWTDLSGGVPDVDDTAGALLALANIRALAPSVSAGEDATNGLRWLLAIQNNDGGWPTFCKGWNRFPFDRSSVDLTAHAIRALIAWMRLGEKTTKMHRAIERGKKFLLRSQQKDGSWLPLWFGNQYHVREENPLYGTAKVLLALNVMDGTSPEFQDAIQNAIHGALRFFISAANEDGGFGCSQPPNSSIEETALVLDAMAPFANFHEKVPQLAQVRDRALLWLVEQVENEKSLPSSPIGLYFTKLWYDEKLYPYIYTTAALGNILKNM